MSKIRHLRARIGKSISVGDTGILTYWGERLPPCPVATEVKITDIKTYEDFPEGLDKENMAKVINDPAYPYVSDGTLWVCAESISSGMKFIVRINLFLNCFMSTVDTAFTDLPEANVLRLEVE